MSRAARRVLVTGGSSGLGAALVAAFAARGDRVLVADLNAPAALAEGSHFLRLDVTSDHGQVRSELAPTGKRPEDAQRFATVGARTTYGSITIRKALS